MELIQAYNILRTSTNMSEVIDTLRSLKDTYKDNINIRLLPYDPSDPLNSMYKIVAKTDKDGWYLPIGEGTYNILKEVFN